MVRKLIRGLLLIATVLQIQLALLLVLIPGQFVGLKRSGIFLLTVGVVTAFIMVDDLIELENRRPPCRTKTGK